MSYKLNAAVVIVTNADHLTATEKIFFISHLSVFPRGTEGSLMKTVLFLVTTIRFNDSTLIEFLIDLKTKIRLFCVCVCVFTNIAAFPLLLMHLF